MRTIVPFASSPLPLHMSPTSTTETHEHLPTSLNPQELSRSASPQQSNLSLLASISLLSSRACLNAFLGIQRPCCSPVAPARRRPAPYIPHQPSATAVGALGFHPVYSVRGTPVCSTLERAAAVLEHLERVCTRK